MKGSTTRRGERERVRVLTGYFPSLEGIVAGIFLKLDLQGNVQTELYNKVCLAVIISSLRRQKLLYNFGKQPSRPGRSDAGVSGTTKHELLILTSLMEEFPNVFFN